MSCAKSAREPGAAASARVDRFEHEEGSPGTDLLVRPGHDLSYPAIHLGANDGLHLHRFEHDQRITSGNDVAGLH